MTKKEFQELTGKSRAQTDKLCKKGAFFIDGHGWFKAVKTGSSKTAPIKIEPFGDNENIHQGGNADNGGGGKPPTPQPPQFVETLPAGAANSLKLDDLKIQKMQLDVEQRQRDLYNKQEIIEDNYGKDIAEIIIKALNPLKKAFKKCKLNPTQVKLITNAFDESLKNVEKSFQQ